jgi:hypothetical protein
LGAGAGWSLSYPPSEENGAPRLVDDVPIPDPFLVVIESHPAWPEHGGDSTLPRASIELLIGFDDGADKWRPLRVTLALRASGGLVPMPPRAASELAAVVDRFTLMAVGAVGLQPSAAMAAKWDKEFGRNGGEIMPTLTIDAQPEARAAYHDRAQRRQRRRQPIDLDEVARVYLAGGSKPLRAVMDHFYKSEAQASRYIKDAREAGKIPER